MRCIHHLSTPLVLALAAVMLVLVGLHHRESNALEVPSEKEAMAAVRMAILNAFNAHDAAALGDLWTADAIHHSTLTGAELAGRQAITDAYAKVFAEEPECSLSVDFRSAKIGTDEAVTIVGVAHVSAPGRAPTSSLFEANLVRVGERWLLARVDETELPTDAAAGLSPLSWLVGLWGEETPNGRVGNRFRRIEGGVFLLREYWREAGPDEPRLHGMQMFTWDAEQSCIRTWVFDSSGSFGEGYWESDGPSRWLNKLAMKLPDGRRAALTQVLERQGEDRLTLQSIDREIDGAPQPNGPIAQLVRQADPAAKAPASQDTSKGERP